MEPRAKFISLFSSENIYQQQQRVGELSGVCLDIGIGLTVVLYGDGDDDDGKKLRTYHGASSYLALGTSTSSYLPVGAANVEEKGEDTQEQSQFAFRGKNAERMKFAITFFCAGVSLCHTDKVLFYLSSSPAKRVTVSAYSYFHPSLWYMVYSGRRGGSGGMYVHCEGTYATRTNIVPSTTLTQNLNFRKWDTCNIMLLHST